MKLNDKPRKRSKPHDTKIYLVVQNGGSSREFYASTYDTLTDAQNAKRGHEKATYAALGPFEVAAVKIGRKTFVHEMALMDAVCDACRGVVDDL